MLTFCVYFLSSKGEGAVFNFHTRLAEALLDGRLDFKKFVSHLELAEYKGKYFTAFGPMPAVLLMPFVALFGVNFHQPYLSILLGSFSVAVCYLTLLKLFKVHSSALWGSLLFGFGTIHWYHANVGSGWYVAQICALFFVWSGIYFGACEKKFFWCGLCFSAAYLSRIPTISCLIFVGLYRFKDLNFFHKKNFSNLKYHVFPLALGILPGIVLNFCYNYFRFGVLRNEAYNFLFAKVNFEPWFQNGYFSFKNIPVHLLEIFILLPTLASDFPYLIPRLNGLAIWFTTPAFVFILFGDFSTKIVRFAFLSLVISALPTLTHGQNGFTQFGYRHTLDYMPFLIILSVAGLKHKISFPAVFLLMLSFCANFWGVYTISWLNLGRM